MWWLIGYFIGIFIFEFLFSWANEAWDEGKNKVSMVGMIIAWPIVIIIAIIVLPFFIGQQLGSSHKN